VCVCVCVNFFSLTHCSIMDRVTREPGRLGSADINFSGLTLISVCHALQLDTSGNIEDPLAEPTIVFDMTVETTQSNLDFKIIQMKN
jgi:hypothetical protein